MKTGWVDPCKGAAPIADLTEQVTSCLEAEREHGGISGPKLAEAIGQPLDHVLAELRELERLGIVLRTGSKRGTRWWVG